MTMIHGGRSFKKRYFHPREVIAIPSIGYRNITLLVQLAGRLAQLCPISLAIPLQNVLFSSFVLSIVFKIPQGSPPAKEAILLDTF